MHLLLCGSVAGAACCRTGGRYRGGPGGLYRVGPGGRYQDGPGGFYRGGPGGRYQDGPGGFYRGGPSGRYRGGPLLMIVLSLALRPFCESYGDGHAV